MLTPSIRGNVFLIMAAIFHTQPYGLNDPSAILKPLLAYQ